MSNPSIRGKSVVLPVARNDPLPVILVNLLPSDGLPSPLRARARVLSRRWFLARHNGRTRYRDQSATNDDDAWKSESRRCNEPYTARQGLIKKPRLTRERHACTRGEPIDGFRGNTRRLSSRVSAHGCRLNLRPRPRKPKKKKKTMKEERRVGTYLYPVL